MDDKEMLKGFNTGYVLEKHEADLARTIKEGLIKDDSPYSKGLMAGIKEAEKEKELMNNKSKARHINISKTKSFVTKKKKQKDKDVDMDK